MRIGQRAQLDPCDVAEPDRGTVGVQPHDDVRELLRLEELPLRSHRVRELLAPGSRVGADASGRIDVVLRRDRVRQIGNGDPELRQLVRLDPDAHRVVGRPEDQDLPDPGNAIERVRHVDGRVVAQEERIVGPLRRVEIEHEERKAGRLLKREAKVRHVGGKLRLRLRHLVLRVHLIDVDRAVDVEGDAEGQGAVVRVDRLHVEHVLDARHLLLDGRRNGSFDRDRIRPRIGRFHLDLRGHDVRILRDW